MKLKIFTKRNTISAFITVYWRLQLLQERPQTVIIIITDDQNGVDPELAMVLPIALTPNMA